jgi:hypothetical protein
VTSQGNLFLIHHKHTHNSPQPFHVFFPVFHFPSPWVSTSPFMRRYIKINSFRHLPVGYGSAIVVPLHHMCHTHTNKAYLKWEFLVNSNIYRQTENKLIPVAQQPSAQTPVAGTLRPGVQGSNLDRGVGDYTNIHISHPGLTATIAQSV